MKRTKWLTLAVLVAMAMGSLAATSYAQTRVTKEQLVGTWILVSCGNAKGNPPPYCVNPKGLLMVDEGGRYSYISAAGNRPRLTAGTAREARSADEYKSVSMGFAATFGTWVFDEADQTWTAHIEAAIFPQNEGNAPGYSVSIDGDTLKQVDEAGGFAIWRRVR